MAVVTYIAGGSWEWLLLAGSLCGVVYEAGYQLRPDKGTEVGEVLFGATIGLGMILTCSTLSSLP
jgi:hypothetical protein